MKKVQSLSIRTIIMMASTILLNAISALTAPIFTRILSTADFGIFSVFTSWVRILSIILGVQTYGTLNNAKSEFGTEDYPNYCFNALFISSVISAVLSVLIPLSDKYICSFLELPEECIIWLIISAYGLYLVNFVSKYLLIEKRAVENLLISLGIALLTTFGSIGLILLTPVKGYYGRILGYAIIYLIAGVCILIYFLNFRDLKLRYDYWKYCLKLSIPLVAHGLSGLLLSQSDRIMLMSRKGDATVGIYSFCYTVALPISLVSVAMNSAWTPEYYVLMDKNDGEEIKKHYDRQIFLMTAISCGYMLVAQEVLKILAVKDYWIGAQIIPLVIIGYYFNFLYFFPANYEFYNKKNKYIASSTLVAAIVNIILNHILIPNYGMVGAAVATIISYVILFFIHHIVAKKITKKYEIGWRFYLKGIIPLSLCYILYILFEGNIQIRWLLGMFIGVVTIIKIIKWKSII